MFILLRGKSSITPTNGPRKPEFSNRLEINSVKRNTQESEIATYFGSYCKLYKTGLNLHRRSLNRKFMKIICFPRLFRKKKIETLSDQTFIFCLLNKMLQFNITIFKRLLSHFVTNITNIFLQSVFVTLITWKMLSDLPTQSSWLEKLDSSALNSAKLLVLNI